jgi:epoxyqueuosine reductase
MRPRLVELGDFIRVAAGAGVTSRAAVDSSAVLERDLAARAGLGWIGKNTNLLTPSLGSYFFIGVVLTTAAPAFDHRQPDRCGTCTACLDACPTRAFVGPYVLDARRCISYLTIEHRGDIPGELCDGLGEWLFGCDVCQDVCPWNVKFARPTTDEDLAPRAAPAPPDLDALDEQTFDRRYGDTPFPRPGRQGMRRNAAAVRANRVGP